MNDIQKAGKRRFVYKFRSSHIIAIGLAAAITVWVASGAVIGNAPSMGRGLKKEPEALTLVRVRESHAGFHEHHLTLFGRTEAIRDVDIAAEITGKIVARPVNKGTWVKKGTPIIKLAMNDRLARLREAQAKVDHQTLTYESAKKLSKKQFQSKIKVSEAKAALEAANAHLAAARLEIRRTTLRAPIDGYIEALPAYIGDYVQPGTVVATLLNLDRLRVVAQVSERQVSKLKTGDVAWATVPNGDSLEGTVRYISRMGTTSTRTFRVEVVLDNPDGKLSEGLTTELRLVLGRSRAHRVSPAVLTLDDSGVIGIKAVDKKGNVVFHTADILEDTTDGVWVGGLPERLTLITVGQEFVRAGQRVAVQHENTKEVVSQKNKS